MTHSIGAGVGVGYADREPTEGDGVPAMFRGKRPPMGGITCCKICLNQR